MSIWLQKTLSQAPLELIDGDRGTNYPSKKDFLEDGFCLFLNAGNVTSRGFIFSETMFIDEERDQLLRKGKLQRGDVILTTRGTVGNVAYYGDDIDFEHVRINSGMVILRTIADELDARFMYFFLRSRFFANQVEALTTGSAQPQLPIRDMVRISMPNPPIDEQVKIVSILSALDDKIENNRRINETLEEMARAIFKSWFVDFDPVHAKAAGNAPAHMDADTAALFPSSFGDDGFPMGWTLTTFGDVCTIKSGKRPPTKLTSPNDENNISVYGGNGIAWYTNEILFEQPFIITGRVGTLGTVYRVYEECWVSDNALCCFPGSEDAFELIYFAMKEVDYHSLNSGSTQPLLTQTTLKNQSIIAPSEPEVAAFHRSVKVLFKKILTNDEENQTLAKLRDTLLPKLMSGEIRVADAEREVEAL